MQAVEPEPLSTQEGGAPVPPAGSPPVRPPPKEVVSALLATMEGLSGRKPDPRPPRDDSPQQQARTLARLAGASPNVVLRLDAAGTVLYANPAAESFLLACGTRRGQRVAAPWTGFVREACECGMVRSEEMEVAGGFYEVTFAPVPEDGYVNVYAVDIARRRSAEAAAREAGERLLRSLQQTIAMVARAVEKRDPSTWGHQQRVAQIAAAIAREMGLAPDRIEGLRLAATIHDIGKVHTPVELLTRPGKLLALELELIRQHPVTGWEIVKDVDFPWPVAQMVLQHHERVDGTGYPRGLKGEAILLEARILAVADVVDGMGMQRPHRPALGLDASLREIEGMRGRGLDAQAVDACLHLFREKGFVLPA